ncbi:MAG: hypothetical protein EPO26_05970 [Chloroflexota bacterium]|nr:MAG: hypothetical protein EPO26_05970 [Chloroflexota bacterium]
MRGPTRLLILLVLPFVIGKALETFLTSRAGRAVANRAGQPEMATEAGIEMAKQYVSASAQAATGAVSALRGERVTARRGGVAAIAEDTAELLLAAGAAVKIVSSFLRDRERLRARAAH